MSKNNKFASFFNLFANSVKDVDTKDIESLTEDASHVLETMIETKDFSMKNAEEKKKGEDVEKKDPKKEESMDKVLKDLMDKFTKLQEDFAEFKNKKQDNKDEIDKMIEKVEDKCKKDAEIILKEEEEEEEEKKKNGENMDAKDASLSDSAFLDMLKGIKPVVASMRDSDEKRKITDALTVEVKKFLNKNTENTQDGYDVILKNTQDHQQDSINEYTKAKKIQEESQKAYDAFNPHLKKEGK